MKIGKLAACFFAVMLCLTVAVAAAADATVSTAEQLKDALAAAAAENKGTVTITVADNVKIEGNFWVQQKAGTHVVVQGGANSTINGRILIDGNTRSTGSESVTIQNLIFDGSNVDVSEKLAPPDGGSAAESHNYFVGQNTQKDNTRYAHNVTVQGCTFKNNKDMVAMKFRQSYGAIVIDDCTADGVHSLLWATNQPDQGFTVKDTTVKNCTEGVTVDKANAVTIENSSFSTDTFGVRVGLHEDFKTTVKVNNSNLNVDNPIVLRVSDDAHADQVKANVSNNAIYANGNSYPRLTEAQKNQIISFTGGLTDKDVTGVEDVVNDNGNKFKPQPQPADDSNYEVYYEPGTGNVPAAGLPRTGDPSMPVLWLMLCMAAAAGMLLLRKLQPKR